MIKSYERLKRKLLTSISYEIWSAKFSLKLINNIHFFTRGLFGFIIWVNPFITWFRCSVVHYEKHDNIILEQSSLYECFKKPSWRMNIFIHKSKTRFVLDQIQDFWTTLFISVVKITTIIKTITNNSIIKVKFRIKVSDMNTLADS